MANPPGVYITKRKDGTTVYRASITYQNKHISLGTYLIEEKASAIYHKAHWLLKSALGVADYDEAHGLPFGKWVVLVNFRDSGFYFRTPIYLHKNYFTYHLSPHRELYFDVDDLFYYSNHQILRRQGYLFVNDYGMQVNILSRYGIRNHSVLGRDYRFIDGNPNNLRYDNIQVLNPYHGIEIEGTEPHLIYKARIHLNGNHLIGRYQNLHQAAIAYNKTVDWVAAEGLSPKHFEKNYIEEMTKEAYLKLYHQTTLPQSILTLSRSSNSH